MGSPSRTSFETLNGLRGIAAIAVVNAHLEIYFAHIKAPNVGLVVDFFFVLSGFVIAHAYQPRLEAGLGLGRFMGARVARLYPLYLLGLAIGATVLWFNWRSAGDRPFAVSLGAGLVFLPPPPALSSNSYNLFPFNFPAWSLFFELVANLVYGLIARRMGARGLAVIIGLSFLGLAAVGAAKGTLDLGVQPKDALGGLARVMFSFFVGVALRRLWAVWPPRVSLHPVLLFALLVAPLLWAPKGGLLWIYDLAVIALYYPALVLLGASSSAGPRWTAACAGLGLISYPLYVLHVPLWDVLKITVDKALIAAAPWSGLAVLAGLLAISWAAEAWLGRPVRAALSRRLARSGAPKAETAVA